MAALLEAVAASPPDVAIELSKEIDWIRVRRKEEDGFLSFTLTLE